MWADGRERLEKEEVAAPHNAQAVRLVKKLPRVMH
jgi:hypothetical protein